MEKEFSGKVVSTRMLGVGPSGEAWAADTVPADLGSSSDHQDARKSALTKRPKKKKKKHQKQKQKEKRKEKRKRKKK